MTSGLPPIRRIAAGRTVTQRFPDRVVRDADSVRFAVLEAQHTLVQLQLIEQIEIGAGPGHVALDDALHALLLEEVTLVVEAVLIAQPR